MRDHDDFLATRLDQVSDEKQGTAGDSSAPFNRENTFRPERALLNRRRDPRLSAAEGEKMSSRTFKGFQKTILAGPIVAKALKRKEGIAEVHNEGCGAKFSRPQRGKKLLLPVDVPPGCLPARHLPADGCVTPRRGSATSVDG